MRYALFFFVLLFNIEISTAQDVKLYVGTASNSTFFKNNFFLQLIICNNGFDTVFIKREDVENLYPSVTADVSDILSGNCKLLITNTTELTGGDPAAINNIEPDGTQDDLLEMKLKQKEGEKKNAALAHVMFKEEQFFKIPPKKCFTIYSRTNTGRQELTKLENVQPSEKERAKVYLIIPAWIYTHKDKNPSRELMISRESKDLKECVFKSK